MQRLMAWWRKVQGPLWTWVLFMIFSAMAGGMIAGMTLRDAPISLRASCEKQIEIVFLADLIPEREVPARIQGCIDYWTAFIPTLDVTFGAGGVPPAEQ